MNDFKREHITISRTSRLFGQKMFLYERLTKFEFGFHRGAGPIMYREFFQDHDPIRELELRFKCKVTWWDRKIYKYQYELVYIDDIRQCVDELDKI